MGGSIKILRGQRTSSGVVDKIIGARNSTLKTFSVYNVSLLERDRLAMLNTLCTVYGQLSFSVSADNKQLSVAGVTLTVDDWVEGTPEQMFARVGLCQGLTQVLDEEESGVIATGIYNNGKFYLFGLADNGVTRAATEIYGLEFVDNAAPLSVMLADNQSYFNAGVPGYDRAAVDQLLGERGVKTVWLEGEGLLDDVTDNWLKTFRVSEVYINT